MSLQVITNWAHRPVIYDYELTPSERGEFDYLDWEAIFAGRDSASFFRYKGQLYDLADFVETPPEGAYGWDAYRSDSYFSGLVIRYCQTPLTGDTVVVGLVLA